MLALPIFLISTAVERGTAVGQNESAFEHLATLVGTWRDVQAPNSKLRIHFALTAGGTVLVETWERAGQPHSLTVYHRDGAMLVATHYCPQGNQPRLALVETGNVLRFTFRDATDLTDGESYLHDLAFDLRDPARVVRGETYRRGTVDDASQLILVRDAAAAPLPR